MWAQHPQSKLVKKVLVRKQSVCTVTSVHLFALGSMPYHGPMELT